ncbi:hypothetical protein [Nocardia sp. BMG51109]|uniref:hypothetical protein n=1 Tax=Nocardia sp. BMG51109 TaxID=1056816 RepID=UPI0004648DE2|nr:hypothetical protein [Nocardia sp. BMG51109]
MSQPPSPSSPYPAPPRITPSTGWYVFAALLVVAGIAGAVAIGVTGLLRSSNTVDDFQRVSIPGSGDVHLTETGGHTVYFEYPGATADVFEGGVNVRLIDPDGGTVALRDYSSSLTYDLGGHEGRAGFSFDAPAPGTYHLVTQGDSGVTAAVGSGIGGSLGTTVVLALGVGVAGVALGIIVFIVVLVRRGASRRRLGPAFGRGGPPPGHPAGPPPPGPHEF